MQCFLRFYYWVLYSLEYPRLHKTSNPLTNKSIPPGVGTALFGSGGTVGISAHSQDRPTQKILANTISRPI